MFETDIITRSRFVNLNLKVLLTFFERADKDRAAFIKS